MLRDLFLGGGLNLDELKLYKGSVLDSKVWSETHVSTGGTTSNPTVTSSTTTNTQFMIQFEDGSEQSVQLGSNFAVRPGSKILVYGFISKPKEGSYYYIGYGNVQTGDFVRADKFGPLIARALPKPFLGGLAIGAVLLLPGLITQNIGLAIWGFLLGWLGLYIWKIVRAGQELKKVKGRFAVDRNAELAALKAAPIAAQ